MEDGALVALITGPLLVFTSWIVPLLTRSAVEGGLGPNALVGIRLPSTMKSTRAWEAGHRAALGPARLLGWLGAVCGVLLTGSAFFLPQGEAPHWVSIVLFVLGYVVILLGGAVWCGVVASRAAGEAELSAPGRPDRG